MRLLNQMVSITLLAAALLSGFLAVSCDRRPQSPPPPTVPEVATVTVSTQQLVLTTELPGRTAAYRVAEIRPQVSGLLLERRCDLLHRRLAGRKSYQ